MFLNSLDYVLEDIEWDKYKLVTIINTARIQSQVQISICGLAWDKSSRVWIEKLTSYF